MGDDDGPARTRVDRIDAQIGAPRFSKPIPFGWFSIGRTGELSIGPGTTDAVAIQAVGRELVAWHDGTDYRVADAFCPHLGAHLGIGGRVEAGCLVCPFHAWAFDGSGVNTSIPYAERTNSRARLSTYPVAVADGHIRVWYHPDPSVEPQWQVPSLIDPSMTHCGDAQWTVRAPWQEMAENSIDMAHFVYVHGAPAMGTVAEVHEDGAVRRVRNLTKYATAKGAIDGELWVEMHGPGTSLTTFDLFGRVSLLATTTPVDDQRCTIRFDFYHGGDATSAAIAEPFAAEVRRQFEQDVPIWENKRYVDPPALAPGEKPITEFRRWAARFYAE